MRSHRPGRRAGLVLLSASCAAALAGPLPDPAFGFTDQTAFAEANAVALQSDGKIVLAGSNARRRMTNPGRTRPDLP